jgi:hypothetical protein
MSTRFDKVPPPLRPEVAERAWSARESWRVFAIMAEFVEATERLNHITPAVSIFGSARPPRQPLLHARRRHRPALSDAGFSVISGGGPGIMEAANKGAYHGRSLAVGLNIELPHQQVSNDFQDISRGDLRPLPVARLRTLGPGARDAVEPLSAEPACECVGPRRFHATIRTLHRHPPEARQPFWCPCRARGFEDCAHALIPGRCRWNVENRDA